MEILFENFSFRYKNLKEPTLKNINLKINAGEKVLIAGQSGSGKSTLMHCINGLIPFAMEGEHSGELLIDGTKPYDETIFEISKKVGTILQDQDSQFIGLSVGEDVAFLLENNRVKTTEMHKQVAEALDIVDMNDFIGQSPYELSGGQKQRVSIAGVISSKSDIMLFDEPLANLDPASGKNVIQLIDNLHKETGKTILIVEHRIEDVLEESVDRIVVIEKGEIIFNGAPEEILASNILNTAGLREPLYVEAIKRSKHGLSALDKIQNIENCADEKLKDSILKWYIPTEMIKEKITKRKMLSVKNVDFSYDKTRKVLSDISFDLHEGEILSVLGNNGAGKSTLSGLISGILKPTKGEIFLNDQKINDWSIKKVGENVGYVMQNPNSMIVKHMLRDEVKLGLEARLVDNRGVLSFNWLKSLFNRNNINEDDNIEKLYLDIIRTCGLYGYRNWPIASLSYGQKRRAAIASILTLDPKIIIMDEPTAGQDYRTYSSFMKFIQELAASGLGIILITHDIHLALEYSSRSIVLCGGEKIADDTPARIFAQTDIIDRANLKETSLGKLASIIGIENKSDFIQFFINEAKECSTVE